MPLRLVLLLALVAGCSEQPFECRTHDQCRLDGRQGRCEHSGYCSYASASCESGWRYHEDASQRLAETCVTELIDDFEDGDEWILPVEGRTGRFSEFTNEPHATSDTSTVTRVPDARIGSDRALQAAGYSDGKAGVQVRLDQGDPYDASRYAGVALWARVAEGPAPRRVELDLITTATSIRYENCEPCGIHFASELLFSAEWTRHAIRFGDTRREGVPGAVCDPGELIGVDLRTLEDGDFAWQIDDVGFLRE